MQYKGFLLVLVLVLVMCSCYEDKLDTSSSANIKISVDSILFDTVFTEIGTVTKRFTVKNPNDNAIKISSITLSGGDDSPYRINVNGVSGKSFNDIVLGDNDSIYVFVEATIDPLNSNLPLVVNDSILFSSNGNANKVQLVAFGQDVHLLNNKVIKSQTWTDSKPYLIYTGVAVDTGEVLTITEGTQIYLHYNSSLLIYGTLDIQGSYENPVVFTGDRLDRGYSVSTGQWGTIYFDEDSRNNKIDYAIIKNSTAGMQIGSVGSRDKMVDVTVSNTFIENASFAGIIGFYADLLAYNTIIADCGSSAVYILMGGKYRFYHTTISSINSYYNYFDKEIVYSGTHSYPSVVASNYYSYYALDRHFNIVDSVFCYDLEECSFVNSIISGERDEEIMLLDTNIVQFNYLFKNAMVDYTETDDEDSIDVSDNEKFVDVLLNADTLFVNARREDGEYNFTPDSISRIRNAGNIELVNQYDFLMYDYEGKSRLQDGKPDMGAIERID